MRGPGFLSAASYDGPPRSAQLLAGRVLLGIAAMAGGCHRAGQAPPFEWWADPLPASPPAKPLGAAVHVGVLVEHTGRRDDFKAFRREVRDQHKRVERQEIPGFKTACHYLPKLAERVREELEEGLQRSGRFMVVKRRDLDKALKQSATVWLDLRRPENAARVGGRCGAQMMLLVEITDCTMEVTEAGRQVVDAKKVGPVRQTEVAVAYTLQMVDVVRAKPSWEANLVRRAGYKLEGPGSMGSWLKPRDPLEFREALRGQGITEFVLRAYGGKGVDDERTTPGPTRALRWH